MFKPAILRRSLVRICEGASSFIRLAPRPPQALSPQFNLPARSQRASVLGGNYSQGYHLNFIDIFIWSAMHIVTANSSLPAMQQGVRNRRLGPDGCANRMTIYLASECEATFRVVNCQLPVASGPQTRRPSRDRSHGNSRGLHARVHIGDRVSAVSGAPLGCQPEAPTRSVFFFVTNPPCHSTWTLSGEITLLGHRRRPDAVEAQGEGHM